VVDVEGLVALLLFGLWIYCIFDVIATDSSMMRNLPKGIWLIIVLLLPDVGSIAWLLLGRPQRVGWRPGDSEVRRSAPRVRPVGPEDSADFIARIEARDRMLAAWAEEDQAKRPESLTGSAPTEQDRRRLEEWEADLARREAELRRQAAPGTPPTDQPG
jgi:hypothetical protein